jgi:phage tail-like protein
VDEAPASPPPTPAPRTRTRNRDLVEVPTAPAAGDAALVPTGDDGPPDIPTEETDFGGAEPPQAWSPPGAATLRSSYLDYLPGIYSGNDFLARYLLIFETIFEPVSRTVGNIPDYFDPNIAPSDVLPWLGSWLGLLLDERWPDARRRELIRSAADLYRWRGTRRGLEQFIRVYTGISPEITEPSLSEISASRDLAFRFTVRLTIPVGVDVDRDLLEQIIDLEKPAFAAGTLEIIQERPQRQLRPLLG